MSQVLNALSVDVEDYFQVSAFSDVVPYASWDRFPCRVEANTLRLLDLFDRYDAKATFFVLGWIAERYPGLVQEIHLRDDVGVGDTFRRRLPIRLQSLPDSP